MSVTKLRINQTQIDFKDAVVAATTAAITTILTGAPDIVDGVSRSWRPCLGQRPGGSS